MLTNSHHIWHKFNHVNDYVVCNIFRTKGHGHTGFVVTTLWLHAMRDKYKPWGDKCHVQFTRKMSHGKVKSDSQSFLLYPLHVFIPIWAILIICYTHVAQCGVRYVIHNFYVKCQRFSRDLEFNKYATIYPWGDDVLCIIRRSTILALCLFGRRPLYVAKIHFMRVRKGTIISSRVALGFPRQESGF